MIMGGLKDWQGKKPGNDATLGREPCKPGIAEVFPFWDSRPAGGEGRKKFVFEEREKGKVGETAPVGHSVKVKRSETEKTARLKSNSRQVERGQNGGGIVLCWGKGTLGGGGLVTGPENHVEPANK